jgi:integrase
MANKVTLTDRKLKSLTPAPAGSRYEIMDAVVPAFGVRVTPNGKRTFILIGRFGGSKHPTRRALGEYGAITLEKARDKARKWIELNQRGTDPKIEQDREKRAELTKLKTSFASVAEDYLKRHVAGTRSAKGAEREIRSELIDRFGARPISEITRADVIDLIEEIADRPAPYYAHLIFSHLRTLFNWAIARDVYGLETSPCDRLKPATLIGAREARQRVLSDAELAALWKATEKIGYPYGPLYRVLLLTGARKNEVAQAKWSEIDLDKKLWVIPPERFKSNASHLIPLTKDVVAILKGLPRFANGGGYVFTPTGSFAVANFSHAKGRIDALMGATDWVTHDLRRTVRTRLASLRVSDIVAEMIIGHGRRGIQRVYDQHSYETEMREGLELWAARLRSIVEPPPANVVKLKSRA